MQFLNHDYLRLLLILKVVLINLALLYYFLSKKSVN
nr:MAG TPA: hypothetical protein [Caudoviricetes sp.]